MKLTLFFPPVIALVVTLAAGAQTPRRSPPDARNPLATPSPSDKDARAKTSPEPRPTPEVLASPSEAVIAAAAPPAAQNAAPPKPVLYLLRTEAYTVGTKNFIRYRYDVSNKDQYPADMFAAAPSLPPCGTNTNSSRTWVDFFDSNGRRLYGFCALSKPQDLGIIWIAFEEGVVPPSYVYIELNDRQTNTRLKSNLADTTL
jgi:hypothetical protein